MWQIIVALVVSLVVSYAMASRVKANHADPAGLGDFDVPTAEVGREIPVLFGTRDLGGPNVVWYGDLKVKKVKA